MKKKKDKGIHTRRLLPLPSADEGGRGTHPPQHGHDQRVQQAGESRHGPVLLHVR